MRQKQDDTHQWNDRRLHRFARWQDSEVAAIKEMAICILAIRI
jgi:hypothetical protein